MASGYMFSHYWPGDGAGGEPPAAAGGYPAWQAGIVVGMNFVPLDPYWKAWFWEKWERFLRWLPLRVWMLIYFLRAWFSPDLEGAVDVVVDVAHDPSTRNLDSWTLINRKTVSNPQWGENMYRALAARVEFGSGEPEAALLLELAYLAYKRKRSK